MKLIVPRMLGVVVAWTALSAVCIGASWKNAVILPKKSDLQLRKSPASQSDVGGVHQIAWPAKVAAVDGQWLKIADAGGYSAKPLEGWVRKSKVIKIDGAQEFFTGKIQELSAEQEQDNKPKVGDKSKPHKKTDPRAEFYWLRGIFWENHGEIDSAIADYEAAKSLNTADIHLHLGRALTELARQMVDVNPVQAAETADRALCAFEQAERDFQCNPDKKKKCPSDKKCPPQLYASWGDAHFQRYRAMGACRDAQHAMRKYELAETLNRSWFVPSYRQGKLLLKVYATVEEAEKPGPDKKTLLAAIQRFTQSIRLNPSSGDSYRDRADALLRLAAASGRCDNIDCDIKPQCNCGGRRPEMRPCNPGESDKKAKYALLDEASASAQRAYVLGYNREPGSLEVKARITAAIAGIHYSGPVPQGPVSANERERVVLAQSLLESAGRLMRAAADRGRNLDEINQRLALSRKWSTDAKKYWYYLNGKDPADYTAIAALLPDIRKWNNKNEQDRNQQSKELVASVAQSKEYVTAKKECMTATKDTNKILNNVEKNIQPVQQSATAVDKRPARRMILELADSLESQDKAIKKLAEAGRVSGLKGPQELIDKLDAALSSQALVTPTYTPLFLDVPP